MFLPFLSRHRTSFLVVVFFVGLIACWEPAQANEEKADEQRLRELLIERRDTWREAVAKYRETLQGPSFRYCLALPWIIRLEESELAACRTDEERIKVYESAMATALRDMREARRLYQVRQELSKKPDSLHFDRMITPFDYLLAKNSYLTAQIRLLPLLRDSEKLFDSPEIKYRIPDAEFAKTLNEYRLKVLKRAAQCAEAELTVGTVTWEELVLAERLLLDASLDLEPDQHKQVELRKDYMKKMLRSERANDHPHGSTRDLRYFRALRTAAQMELMRITAALDKTDTPIEDEDQYQKLAATHMAAVVDLLRFNEACYQTGTIVVETYFNGLNLALSSGLSQAKSAEDRIRIREEHLEECRRMERMITKQRYKLLQSFLFGKAERLTAEVDLLREQMRAEKQE